jgi:hypothetical protein
MRMHREHGFYMKCQNDQWRLNRTERGKIYISFSRPASHERERETKFFKIEREDHQEAFS